jgi:hypothetical protein
MLLVVGYYWRGKRGEFEMNVFLKNLLDLFSDEDPVIYKAIRQKKDWLFVPLFLRGDLDQIKDIQGLLHFRKIEALLDDVLPFEKPRIPEEISLSNEKRKELDSAYEGYRVLRLETDIHTLKDAPFFAEYDFTQIDQRGYHALLANFYPCLSAEELEIKPDDDYSMVVNQLKPLMVGPKGQCILILESHLLIQDSFYAPVLRKIHANPVSSLELREELRQICKEKGIIYTEE